MGLKALQPPFRVLIVEDHKFVAELLSQRLGMDRTIEVVGLVSHGAAAVQALEQQAVDIVLLDMELEQEDGLGVARQLLALKPDIRLVGLSMHDRDHYPLALLQLGAAGFLSKRTSLRDVAEGVRRAAAGELTVSPEIAAFLATQRTSVGPLEALAQLTPKESEVLGGLAEGLSVREIAGKLALAEKTVQAHRNSLRRKLQARTDVELCLFALKSGLLDLHRVRVGER